MINTYDLFEGGVDLLWSFFAHELENAVYHRKTSSHLDLTTRRNVDTYEDTSLQVLVVKDDEDERDFQKMSRERLSVYVRGGDAPVVDKLDKFTITFKRDNKTYNYNVYKIKTVPSSHIHRVFLLRVK